MQVRLFFAYISVIYKITIVNDQLGWYNWIVDKNFYYLGDNMAGVLTLAEGVPCNAGYVSDPIWIEAGSQIMLDLNATGSGSYDFEPRVEGSLDGSTWHTVSSAPGKEFPDRNDTEFVPENSFYTLNGFIVNYIRYVHEGFGSSEREITVKVIQPNFQRVDVMSLPA